MSVYTGESRGELLAWLNELLSPTVITDLTHCGTGAIYCQIVDSIFGDLPMSRVKLNARMEYEYLENYKILQKAFTKHRIEKPIPVDKLVKCKMQDNLEFLQWMKKYWDMNSRGDGYDAAGRAGGVVASFPSTSKAPNRAAATTSARAATRTPVSRTGPGARVASSASVQNAQLQEMSAQFEDMQVGYAELEKERDFYFGKLRNIEVIVQERSGIEGIDTAEREVLAKVQEILYSTSDGFESPANNGDAAAHEEQAEDEEEEETF